MTKKKKTKVYSVCEDGQDELTGKSETIIIHLRIRSSDLQVLNDGQWPAPQSSGNFMEIKCVEEEKSEADPVQSDLINDNCMKNINSIMYEFVNSNLKGEWPNSTTIYCYWCCHPFDSTPCALPIKYVKQKFYMTGCFCSFNCAASYNYYSNVYDREERYSLLCLLYKKVYGNNVKIALAPPREVLKIFGGYMTITEFRNALLRQDVEYRVLHPPMISVIPKIEEKRVSNLFVPFTSQASDQKPDKTFKFKKMGDVPGTLESFGLKL